jgi:short-subunit dehydrogenase
VRTILVTGASAGLGKAIALELALRGDRLALTARRGDRLKRVAEAARAAGAAEVLVLPADLADPQAPERLIAATLEEFGALNVLVNNAGYGLPDFYHHCGPEELGQQIAVNLTAPLLLARHAIPALIASRGLVINIGSAITSVANPMYGLYGTTKAGLAYWNDALRRELKPLGVHVCLVEPGPVDTEFFDAVKGLSEQAPAYGTGPPTDRLYNPMRDRPPRILTARVEDAARRIVRLVDHPRRRLSFLRRMIWPWRLVGGLFQLAPALGDLAVCGMIARVEREHHGAARGV